MDIKRVGDGDVIEIDGKFRIEKGPKRLKAVATAELLDDEVTAAHYHAPRKVKKTVKQDGKDVVVEVTEVAVDALGKPIELGKEMNYIDWKNRRTNFTYYVYQLKDVEEKDKDGKKTVVKRFIPLGDYPDEMAALSYVTSLK